MKRTKLFLMIGLLLCFSIAHGQFSDSTLYDFRDGAIITAGESVDGALTLSGGSFKLHGAQYGLNMKVDGEINVAVAKNSTVRFLGSVYSGLNMTAVSFLGDSLGEHPTKVTADLAETFDFVYAGNPDTINFKTIAGTGGDLYLPYIEVVPEQNGGADTVLSPIPNIIYYFDLRDSSIIPANTSLNGNYTIDQGLFKVESGASNAYGYNGAQHGSILKTGNKITLKVAGNAYIKIGGCQYSNGTIDVSSSTGEFDIASQQSVTSACWDADSSSVDFLYVGDAGEVVLEFTGTTYIPIIHVVPVPFDISLSSYVQKSGTITIDGKTIDLTSGASAADLPAISLSEGIVLSTSTDETFVAMNLGGVDLSSVTPDFTGDIDTVIITDTLLTITWNDQSTDPKSYGIVLYDNSYFRGVKSYDFRDGSIITAGQSTDGSLTLTGGSYSLHGATYGLNMKVDGNIDIAVDGSSSFKFLGSEYSALNLTGSATSEGDLGTQETKVINDLSDTYDFVYAGLVDTLNFKTTVGAGNDLYLPIIDVYPAQFGAAYASVTENIVYYFDFRDGSIIPTTTAGNTDISKGLVDIKVGSSNAYGYNGGQHGSVLKEGNQIVLKVAGNSYIKVGGCIYSNGTMSVSSATGNFDIDSQPSQAASEFHTDGTTIDFLYVGEAGEVTIDFTGTTYVPYIEVAPVPYEVSLETWVEKSGTIALNGDTIDIAAGASSSEKAIVTIKHGSVVSATAELANVRMALDGKALSTYTPSYTGNISSVEISGDTILIAYADSTTIPFGYALIIADNSVLVEAEAGKTYAYDFADGSVLPQTSYSSLRYNSFVTEDGILTMNSNTETESQKYGYHDAQHGAVLFPGNSMDIIVAGNATVNFGTCQYGGATDSEFEFTDAEGNVLGAVTAHNIGVGAAGNSSYTYNGPAGVITATLKSAEHAGAEIYIHGLTVENAAFIEVSNGKADVWDFGGVQLDTAVYNNMLNDSIINAWYDASISPGTSGTNISGFSSGVLSYVGGSSDRLRTTNTNLTRYDENTVGGADYTGRIYVNSSSNAGRYMSLTLSADDEVRMIVKSDAGGNINFEYVADPSAQTDQVSIPVEVSELYFVAKEAGTYHVFDDAGKPSYFRIIRKDADYVNLTGAIDTSAATGLPDDYKILFTNEAGKVWEASIADTNYKVKIPANYTYMLSLANANGYIISNGTELAVTESTSDYTISVKAVELYNLAGSINGIDDIIANLKLAFIPDSADDKIFVPEPIVDTGAKTYTVMLEPNCKYTIMAKGVNDFYIPVDTIIIGQSAATSNIAFDMKPLHHITINATGIEANQLADIELTFSNLNEEGYVYTFTSADSVDLRDGVYAISYTGLDAYPVKLRLTSNLTVDGAATSKDLVFNPVFEWEFNDKVISGDTYLGLQFTGTVGNQAAKSHLTASPGATIKIPVNAGDKIRVTYYYTADFAIEGTDTFYTESKSTGQLEYAEYSYTGSDAGFVTLTMRDGASTTYITNIAIGGTVAYAPVINVGADKDYKTVNEALSAVANMVRASGQRVTIMIDPGNYEEMLVVNVTEVTLKNAAENPSIALKNSGVDIDNNAVRITGYYGHGYNYYSMGDDHKWNADLLRVNKENGYLTSENAGSGTTRGSYWNATVVVSANGFEAEDIIFENSFNQYISKKESEDVVVMWESGSKGERPTDAGNTAVQNRSFVERAAAVSITSNIDKVILNNCRIVGRQDALYGGSGSRVAIIKGAMMGAVDYIFGGMTAVFYRTELVMNNSDVSGDATYITAAQQSGGRGYLMYECRIISAVPGVETASTNPSKPGYFGRPWQATTSEVVFYNTIIDASGYPGATGSSLIEPIGWNNSLGGESEYMYELGSIEISEQDNTSARASWATLLTEAKLKDNTDITPFNFTKGGDNWDPIVMENDSLSVSVTSLDVEAGEASTASFEITSNVVWTISSDQTWLVASKLIGFDNAEISLTADANLTGVTRTATISVSATDMDDKQITITQPSSVGIDNNLTNRFNVYPNPSNGLVNIRRGNAVGQILKVFNTVGQVVYQQELYSLNESIDLSMLQSGMYFVNINEKQIKLIIE